MKNLYRIVLLLSLPVLADSCMKEKILATDYIGETTAQADDHARFSLENDGVAADISALLETTAGFSGRGYSVQSAICDATVTADTSGSMRTLTITFNGSNCLGTRTRSGSVVISMEQDTRWRNPGATVNVSFQDLRITRNIDQKSITLNGTQVHTNVSGGLIIDLPTGAPITHTITSSDMSITFDNGQERHWNVARRRVFTYNNGIVLTSTGTSAQGSFQNVAEWGSNRFGNPFITYTTQPLVIRQDCGFRLVSGKVAHSTNLFNSTVTFGLDASGLPALTCPSTGNYFMKINWTGPSGLPRMVILPY